MIDHQEQQTCKDNIDYSQEILKDQLDKHSITDLIEDILKNFENQREQNKTYTHNKQFNSVPTGNSTSDTEQESTQYNRTEITINKGAKYLMKDKKTV